LQQQVELLIASLILQVVDIVDDVAVGNGQIEVRIVVVVEERGAETHKRQRRLADTAGKRDVVE
jgi:hypothetical protein